MFSIALSLAGIFAVLLANEYLWRKKALKGETARKFLHIIIGSFVAFWPLYMDWLAIQVLALAATIFFLIMRYTRFFRGVYEVKRRSWGDLIGPATIVVLALLEPSPTVFAAAVLHISLADGFAAVIGSTYGTRSKYKILWNTKSITGTITFWLASFSILVWGMVLNPGEFGDLALPVLLWLPLMTAFLENISPYGFDNLFVPLLVAVILQYLQAAV